jgi:hypothetical protein
MQQLDANLHIEHNHGYLILSDVSLEVVDGEPSRVYPGEKVKHITAHGTVVKGVSTSRLFHATKTNEDTVGELVSYPLNRMPDKYSDGTYHTSVVTCG